MIKVAMSCVVLLLLLTAAFLVVPSGMVGSLAYNVVAFLALTLFMFEYVSTQQQRSQRIHGSDVLFRHFRLALLPDFFDRLQRGNIVAAPPFVYEAHRIGEALMVLASFLTFVAYGQGLSLKTKNRVQRNRAIWFWATTGTIFTTLIFTDYLLGMYDPALASAVRQASQGIGWIFQFGMGYTFYLPFAIYIGGLLCWSYTVIKLLNMGRLAGYGMA